MLEDRLLEQLVVKQSDKSLVKERCVCKIGARTDVGMSAVLQASRRELGPREGCVHHTRERESVGCADAATILQSSRCIGGG